MIIIAKLKNPNFTGRKVETLTNVAVVILLFCEWRLVVVILPDFDKFYVIAIGNIVVCIFICNSLPWRLLGPPS